MEKSVNHVKNNKDPVCGMILDSALPEWEAFYKGRTYYFCAETCRTKFEKDPVRYLKPKPEKRKGWWGRYLERLARANEKTFGCSGPKCH